MNKIYETEAFGKIMNAAEKREQEWIEKIKDQLVSNLLVGKPLGFVWFREKKFENKRLYYIVNESTKNAVLIAFGSKKEQQRIIDHILINRELYFQYVK